MATKDREKASAYWQKYYQKNHERLLQRSRDAHRNKSKEQVLKDCDRASAWYYANKERAHAASKAWSLRNPEKVREYHKKVLANNPGRREYYHCLRRSRELWAGPPDKAHLAALMAEKHCFYCGVDLLLVKNRPFNPQRLVIEHKTPVSRGGTNANDNLVAACARCNVRKHKKTAEEFLASQGR